MLLANQGARGQAESATLLGTVRTADGDPAGNMEISIRRPATNESYSLLTGPGGNYRRDSLAAGNYEIQVAALGCVGQLRIGVRLLVGQTVREDFVLIPGDENEVRVQESGWVPSGSDRDDRGLVIDREKLETLPVASRDIGQLVDLAPGASRTSSGRRRGVKVMGMRRRDNLLYIDGTLFTHGDGGTSFQASTDALQEFDIKSGLYSAEYGIRPGAQIVAVTKSGTNAYHGSLYWFHRNDNLDARNFFEQEKKEFKRNQMGATLGGPIVLPGLFRGTDRAWFFLSHQHRSIRETKPLTGVVPTSDERKGIFSTPITDPSTGAPFPDNRIPEDRFDPVALKLLPIWPDPNSVGPLNFTSPDSVSPTDNPQIIARVDLKTSGVSRWSGRFVWDSRPSVMARPVSIFSSHSPLATWGQAISYRRNLGSRDVNVASIHLFRRPYEAVAARPLPDLAGSLGIDQLVRTEVDRHGVPRTQITGFVGIGDLTLSGGTALGNWQVKDDLVLPRGDHTLKLGLEYRQHFNQYGQHRRSEFDFYNRYTGNAWGDFLLGHLARSQLGGEFNRGRFHQNSVYAYISDEWRVRPGLDLNLGLRYELRLPWVDLRGFMSNFDPGAGRLHPPLQNLDLAPGETGRFQPGTPLVQWGPHGGNPTPPGIGAAARQPHGPSHRSRPLLQRARRGHDRETGKKPETGRRKTDLQVRSGDADPVAVRSLSPERQGRGRPGSLRRRDSPAPWPQPSRGDSASSIASSGSSSSTPDTTAPTPSTGWRPSPSTTPIRARATGSNAVPIPTCRRSRCLRPTVVPGITVCRCRWRRLRGTTASPCWLRSVGRG